jgi:hypothetical protein
MIERAAYTETGAIEVVVDGIAMTVPDVPGNRHRQAIADWEAEGNAIAAYEAPATRRRVAKSLIIQRLHEAGLLADAKAALDADLYVRERWYAPDRPAVYSDDAEALALLSAIGADAEAVMAP